MTTGAATGSLLAVDDEEPGASALQRLSRLQGFQILVLLVVLIVGFSLLEPTAFASVSNLRAIVVNTAILAVLGVGMTFVIITGGIDLSIGSVLVFSGVVASKVMTAAGGQGWGVAILGILVAVGCGTAWGVINGVVIAKWNIPPLIVTLGTLGMSLGFAQIITGGVDIREVPEVLVDTIGYGQIGGEIPVLVVVSAILVVTGMVLLHRTRFGLYTYAVGSNAEGSRRVGVNVNRQLIKIYALSGCTAGIAGILSLAYFQATTIGGQTTTNLNVIAGVVIGGTSLFGGIGSVFGTVIGLFVPAVLQNGFVVMGIQPFWQQVVVGAVLIVAVGIDQHRRTALVKGGPKRKGLSGGTRNGNEDASHPFRLEST